MLDWIIQMGTALTIAVALLLIGSLSYFSYISINQRKLNRDTLKMKKKNRKKKIRKVKDRQKAILKRSLGLFICGLLLFSVTAYARYYQKTTISFRDNAYLVDGYYLIDQLTMNLTGIIEKGEILAKDEQNLHLLGIRMASYSNKRGYDKSSEEAQRLLNRYYHQIGELGVNIASDNLEIQKLEDDQFASYLKDIESLEKIQEGIFSYYQLKEQQLDGK